MSIPTDDQREGRREGSLEAPTRHALDWTNPDFYNEASLLNELERVFDICHGCRRCFNLCQAFPTLFDAIDGSEGMELDGVPREHYWNVVDHCYLCDMCYMTKCPYVPPHVWNIDFPHLMLRAKAVKFRKDGGRLRDRLLTSTDTLGKIAGIPVVAGTLNAANRSRTFRKALDKTLGVHPAAALPEYQARTFRRRWKDKAQEEAPAAPTARTRGRVALFTTCYGNYNEPHLNEDLVAVFRHNGIPVLVAGKEKCCGMPKLELGDLDSVRASKEANIPVLAKLVDEGWDVVAPVPSCVLIFKQELPLLFPDDPEVSRVRDAFFDPFEYLMLRHQEGRLRTDFKTPLGKISYHVACHLRVQNIGMKTREMLQLVPDTNVEPIERCSGHDGTYALKSECHEASMKICRPVVRRVEEQRADYYTSDCPMAGRQIESGLKDGKAPVHPLSLLRIAYDI